MKKIYSIILIFIYLFINSISDYACTGFYVAKGNVILAGNNEDMFNPETKMWVIPGESGNYGRIFFGFDDYTPQGGINEKGLFFDGFGVEPKKVPRSFWKKNYNWLYNNFMNEILSSCATVDEVIGFVKKYNLDFMENFMFFFGDSKGNSVIVEGDALLRKKGDFQITTNFRQSENKPITCDRYKTVYKMLTESGNISVDRCRDILKASSQDITLYSQVYDFKNLIIYVYNRRNFDKCVKIDLKEELKKGLTYYDLPSLFERKTRGSYEKQPVPDNADIYRGHYKLISLEPNNASYKFDPAKHISIDFDGNKLVITELFGSYRRCVLTPEKDGIYSYKSSYNELRLSFSIDNKNVECICKYSSGLETSKSVCEKVDK